jgi:hypothetical protein
MSPIAALDQSVIKQWMVEKLDCEIIEQRLLANGLELELIAQYLKEYKRHCIAKRQYRGFIFCASGAFLGFVSCILTVFNPVPELYNYILYGLTSVAIMLIFAGLYFLFE